MTLKIYLIRHGETNFNKASLKSQQNEETPLNELGIVQTERLAKRLESIHFDKIFSSPLKRATQTLDKLRKLSNKEVFFDDRLKEYDSGEVNQSSEKWKEKYDRLLASGMSKYDIRPFGGENIWDLIKRVGSFLKDIEKEEGVIAIITHSGVSSMLINLSQGRKKEDFSKIKQNNTCINLLEFSGREWKIKSINDSKHISDIFSKKTIYPNQNEIKKIIEKEIIEKLGGVSEKMYLGGDLISREFGSYDRPYERHEGSPIEVYAKLKKGFEISIKWGIVHLFEGVKKYEIGKIYIENTKHKINLNLINDKKEIENLLIEKIL
ncbi:histidine phosphatase family protein [Candidatus Pacearchaeota archaeon]|nr:histidine phosphatase family protein [Candidatus Pacearchaeota archaeon]